MGKENKKIVVIGGVAGGASFAARMRRVDEYAQIVMFEKGQYISFANCGMPYHIGQVIEHRKELVLQTPQSFSNRFAVEVRVDSEVIAVDTEKKRVRVKHGNREYYESYDYLVLSPGASPILPDLAGMDSKRVFTLRTLHDMDRIKNYIDSSELRDSIVVGGGFIGLEMAENLSKRGIKVSLIEASGQLFAPADSDIATSVTEHLEQHGIDVHLHSAVQSFFPCDSGKYGVKLKNNTELQADMVILAIGVKPDTDFLKGSSVQLSQRGAIKVDEQLKTSVPDVFAVGDAIESTDLISKTKTHIPLAGPANRQGRIVADRIAGIESVYHHTQGTAICKIFGLTIAVTGINEKKAAMLGIEYLKSYSYSPNHASYYPGAQGMSIKILFSPQNGTILGAQIAGAEGVDKRIDLLAMAVRHKLTVNDLCDLELAYAPPYGSARDPVNTAGFIAQNIITGIMPVCYAEQIPELIEKGYELLDVRTQREVRRGTIMGAKNIELDQLRERIEELDQGKNIIVFCEVGLRGHVAVRILLQNGFNAFNLSGGFKVYKMHNKELFSGTQAKASTYTAV
ncbi:FAD-dependent oxidoreductase [Chitinispirillales bacterium ANBcel5]|uniref:FAD-dependent oxidoreductase n=1 Tax=Cellulosispirillum alkaliphilum TaxID=3039283 RepID=UPI002A54109C|nr:FAD-dependent oxidoreductase [Chitinispirillales bacterium ANBcel5]